MQPKKRTQLACLSGPFHPRNSASAPLTSLRIYEFVYSTRCGVACLEVLRNTRAKNNQNIISRLFKALANEACNNFLPSPSCPYPLLSRFMEGSFAV